MHGVVRSIAVLAALAVSGCAQQQGNASSSAETNAVPAEAPIDRWDSGVEKDGSTVVYANAGIATAARDAQLLLGCPDEDKSVLLLVGPNDALPIKGAHRPVTVILDGATTFTQRWWSGESSYSTAESDPGFAALLAALKRHNEVEFVLGEPGRVIDRRRFKLEGAAQAIDVVVSNCATKD